MQLVKESIVSLKGYKPNTLPYQVKLDANEGSNYMFKNGIAIQDVDINFYPDSESNKLKHEISQYIQVPVKNLIVGNGSSEMIELILKTYVDKNELVLSFDPSFSMYQIYSQIYSARFDTVESNADFSVNMDLMIDTVKKKQPKVIFICTPNNPTGYLIPKESIKKLLDATNAIVVVDEAYMEFSDEIHSMIPDIHCYPNLVVLRTLSKAFGLASIRLGYMIANEEIIDIINKVKSPYNLNALTQYVGIKALKQKQLMISYVNDIKEKRSKVDQELKELKIDVYPSHGNFIFFKCLITQLFEKLANKGILIRKYTGTLEGYYRVTIGSNDENNLFIKGLKEIINDQRS